MSDYAYDFSTVPGPAPSDLVKAGAKGILGYSFAARQPDGYLDACRAAGLTVVWVWERNTDSIFGGYDYAVAECRAHEQSTKPGELTYVACDTNDGGVAGRDLSPFLHGWADTTREPVFGLYGSSGAIRQGQAFGGKLERFWGVVNWINGGEPDNAPENIAYWTNAGVHLVQLIGSPIPDTDQNLILKPDWGSLNLAPVNPFLEDDMAATDYFATDPTDRRSIWWFSAAGRRHVSADEWAILTFDRATKNLDPIKPFAGSAALFAATPDVTSYAGAKASTAITGPLTITGSFTGQAA